MGDLGISVLLGLEMWQISVWSHLSEVVLQLFSMYSSLRESHSFQCIQDSPDARKSILSAVGLTVTVTQKLLYSIVSLEGVGNR